MKVITLSKVFLSGHPQAGQPTHFREKFLSGEKIHTIRLNAKNYYKEGDMVSVRQWKNKPYVSKQEEIGQVQIGQEAIKMRTDFLAMVSGVLVDPQVLAKNDGLELNAFKKWFFPKAMKRSFLGDIIHFTPFRYSLTTSTEGNQ